jgi:hypothetical protein
MVIDDFQNSQPDIDQAQAGNRAAHESQMQKMLETGPAVDETGFEPGAAPRQPHQSQTHCDAE